MDKSQPRGKHHLLVPIISVTFTLQARDVILINPRSMESRCAYRDEKEF